MPILALNAGSSSVKFALFDAGAPEPFASGRVDLEQESIDYPAAAARAIDAAADAAKDRGGIQAAGHRIVHGGPVFRSATLLDPQVESALAGLASLAPLHNPPALAVLHEARGRLPGIPHVAVFDTAFFAELPQRAHVYPVPWEWYEEKGIRRYGFHGLSHEGSWLRAADLLRPSAPPRRLVTCHLGQGCSAAAIAGGKPKATTMGLTPIEGLMMGSRSGSVDPGILIELLRRGPFDADALEDALVRRSGLLGVSGVSSDFRRVEEAAAGGHARARLALDMYADRVSSAIGSLATVLGGLDALVFTGGVGEHSSALRAAACGPLGFAGVRLDPARNASAVADAEIGETGAPVRVFALKAREEWMIAKQTLTACPLLFGRQEESSPWTPSHS